MNGTDFEMSVVDLTFFNLGVIKVHPSPVRSALVPTVYLLSSPSKDHWSSVNPLVRRKITSPVLSFFQKTQSVLLLCKRYIEIQSVERSLEICKPAGPSKDHQFGIVLFFENLNPFASVQR